MTDFVIELVLIMTIGVAYFFGAQDGKSEGYELGRADAYEEFFGAAEEE